MRRVTLALGACDGELGSKSLNRLLVAEKENYEEAVRTLNGHHIVKTNARFQRHVFGRMMQSDG